MSTLKKSVKAIVRWSWFGLLVLTAFGYLVAGLSETPGPTKRIAVPRLAALEPTVAELNDIRRQQLLSLGLPSAETADWLTICRRMSLALVGSGLSLEEIRELEMVPEARREQVHLQRLLGDARFHDYWAERWTRFLVGTDTGQFIVYRRRRFRIWLAQTFSENLRYDRLVRRLVTSKGLWTDRPEVNFLTSTFDSNDNQPDPVRLAARTSRAFLGLRIDCLQCHDDFLGNVSLGDAQSPRGGLQTDFHQLAAFFTAAQNDGLQGVRDRPVNYQYQFLDEENQTPVEAKVPYQPELFATNDGGRKRDARSRLADWITHPENRQAARAAVSHVWALMFGRPMGDSVDNLPLDQTHPPMMEYLADDFVQNDYDLRRLIRLIAGSDSFRVSSRANFEITAEHEDQGAVFPLVRLRPEQVAGSVIQAARVKRIDRDSKFILQMATLTENNDFVKRYGDIGEDEFETDSITITQRLLLMNGKLVREHVRKNPILNTTSHVQMFAEKKSSAVEVIYLCVLNRYPTEEERQHFLTQMEATKSRHQIIEDLMWVLINSSELAWNH